ncbi:unnamed protein product [Prorocentrum cordatum]|uniref:Adenylate cyclase n=1 Tax=Prorocentrum cordatum TaxID=2364126 RepID=A0ABN9SUC4_9DINO|nr:unnamed protein product [Polarella glacialis]
MGAGCIRAVKGVARDGGTHPPPRGASKADDAYMERPDVHLLLERLRSDRPDDLAKWLPTFASSELASASTAVPSVITRDMPVGRVRSVMNLPCSTHSRRGLDWRHNIFDAETSVLKVSRDVLRMQQTRRQAVVTTTDGRLHSFLPQVIVGAIMDGRVNATDPVKVIMESPIESSYNPVVHSFDAAVVFMDASGFTSLTEKLALQSNGAEEIGKCINSFFTPLIALDGQRAPCAALAGLVAQASHESCSGIGGVGPTGPSAPCDKTSAVCRLLVFGVRPELGGGSESGTTAKWSPDAATAVAAACRCCLEVQSQVGSFGSTPVEGLSLTLHIGVGVGPLNLLQLGGLMNRWEYCAAGPPLEEVAVAEPLAKSGETVVSPSVVETLRAAELHGEFAFREVPEAPGYQALASRDVAVGRPPGAVLSPSRDYGSSSLTMSSLLRPTATTASPTLAPLDLSMVERYFPRTILRMVTGDLMSDEMRRASIVFLSIGKLDPGRGAADAKRMQVVVRLLQRSIYALEGSLNKILVDDKGILVLACFGLPPLNHYTDDPLRAVLAAARFIDTLREEDLTGRAGVATGTCWCGIVGSALRREYTVPAVFVAVILLRPPNAWDVCLRGCAVTSELPPLAAAMCSPGAVPQARPAELARTEAGLERMLVEGGANTCRVDESTRDACKHILKFSAPRTISLKGKANPLSFYMFDGNRVNEHLAPYQGSFVSKGVLKQLDSTLMNWQGWPAKSVVFDALEEQIDRPIGPCGVIFTKGQAGCGKTEVAAHIRTWARSRGCTLFSGQNMNVAATFAVQLQCWVEVFKELMATAAADPYWLDRLEQGGMTPGDLLDSSASKWNLLTTMLLDGGADEDLMAWAPMMSIVLSSLDFGTKEVQAMLERDEQHSNGRSRLGELCAKLIDSFASFGSNRAGTVILLHIKESTSFYQSNDYHSGRIVEAVSQLCVDKRHEPNARPLIFCVVSRSDGVGSGRIIDKARACNGYVEIEDLNAEQTGAFLSESLQNRGLRRELVDYVYRTSGGNPFAIRALCESMKEQTGHLEATAGSKVEPYDAVLPRPAAAGAAPLSDEEHLSVGDPVRIEGTATGGSPAEFSRGKVVAFNPMTCRYLVQVEGESTTRDFHGASLRPLPGAAPFTPLG